MSEIKALEQKIDSLHLRQGESTERMEKSIEKMSQSIETFVAFQARAEERHFSSNTRLDKVEKRTDKLWDMVHKNSLVVNGVVAVVTAIIIWSVRGLLGE